MKRWMAMTVAVILLLQPFLLTACSSEEVNAAAAKPVIVTAPSAAPTNAVVPNALKTGIEEIIKNEKAFYSIGIVDLKTNASLYINAEKLRAASIIKIFVMVTAFKQIRDGQLDVNKKITLTQKMKVGGTGILIGAKVGTKKTIGELIELMITHSDNTAANILVNELSFTTINDTIADFGCKDTHLGYYFVLPPPKGVTNTTSVKDLNTILKKIYQNDCINQGYDRKMIEIMSKTVNKTKLPALLPGHIVVAHKTGSIIAHEHDAGIVFGPKNDYIISVMTQKATDPEGAKRTIAKISKFVYDFYNK